MTPPASSRAERIRDVGFDPAMGERHPVTSCNLCGGSLLVRITHSDRYGYAAPASACRRCGLVFLDPVMSADAYGRFYQDVYRPLVSAYHGRLIDARTIQDEQREYAERLATFLRPLLKPATKGADRLLDIGGSTGVVAGHLVREFGFRATILDPAPDELACAGQEGMEALPGLVEEVDLPPASFDAVIICQTVDHLLDIAGTLHKVRETLKPDGWLFIDIVDFRAAYLRNHRVEEAVKTDHPYYLVQETMEAYLARTGFRVERIDYAPDHLHIGYFCRPGETDPNALPTADSAKKLLREIRWIQNTKHLAPK